MPTPIPTGIVLEAVIYNGPSIDKKNLLFLGDGFDNSATDRKLFKKTIDQVVLRFFKKAPFNLRGVKNKFNIFKAFTPSPSSGISCHPDMQIDANGIPLDAAGNVIEKGLAHGPPVGKIQPIQSALGLQYDLADRYINSKTGDENLIANFIATLSSTTPFEIGESSAQTAIPQCWAKSTNIIDIITGKDFGLVLVLINDDKHGGSGNSNRVTFTLGRRDRFNIANVAPNVYSHTPNGPRNDYKLMLTGVHHELGHSHFNLHEEYSELHDPVIARTKNFYSEENVVTKADVTNAGGDIDPSLIKWNKELFPGSADKIISTAAFNYMKNNKKPLWERPAGTVCANVGIDYTTLKLPPKSIYNGIQFTQRIIGLYEGAGGEACGVYAPAGSCRMKRLHYESDFCYVCKHAIIERIDSSLLERLYQKCYPRK